MVGAPRGPSGQTPLRTRSHKSAQDRTIYLFDCALRINYWRNGRVELRPPPGRAHFCVTGDPRCRHPGRAARPTGRPHASATYSVVLSTSANIEFDGRGLPIEANTFGQNE